MNEIKEFKKLNKILLYDGDPVITDVPFDDLAQLLESDGKFMNFGDRVINKSNVKEISTYDADDLEQQILTQPRETQKQLRVIIKEREAKHQRISGFSHLWEIYENRLLIK